MTTQVTRSHIRRTQAERSSQTRTALLDATLDLLVESGYKATTTTAVAQRAEMSLGALLHHFPTKTDLLVAAIGHAFDRRIAEYRQVMAQLDPAADTLDATLDLLWSMCTSPTFIAFVELWVAARTDPELAGPLVAFDKQFLKASEQIYTDFVAGDQMGEELARTGLHMAFSVLSGLAFSNMLPEYDPFASTAVMGAYKAMVRTSLAAMQSASSPNT